MRSRSATASATAGPKLAKNQASALKLLASNNHTFESFEEASKSSDPDVQELLKLGEKPRKHLQKQQNALDDVYKSLDGLARHVTEIGGLHANTFDDMKATPPADTGEGAPAPAPPPAPGPAPAPAAKQRRDALRERRASELPQSLREGERRLGSPGFGRDARNLCPLGGGRSILVLHFGVWVGVLLRDPGIPRVRKVAAVAIARGDAQRGWPGAVEVRGNVVGSPGRTGHPGYRGSLLRPSPPPQRPPPRSRPRPPSASPASSPSPPCACPSSSK
mmetsp:Transcript_8698/g.22635  ORF Transcript_8698/g.22635 Transcript_8698/m.22635 type:complete len:276 (-) Transcript_8698:241-1068(-)